MALRLLLSISFLFVLTISYAQQTALDSAAAADTVRRHKFVPTGLRIGVDIVSPIRSVSSDNFTGWETSADVDIHRYILSIDVGSSSREFLTDSSSYTSTYSNDGKYWRVGLDANFLTRDPDRNVFFIGFRYAQAKYNETMHVFATDQVWGSADQTYQADNDARWFELASGMKVKIWRFIWLGYTGSLKFGLKKDENTEIISFDVPGYGSTSKNSSWGFTYSVYFRIPFRPTTSILPPKKKKK